jgi:hypothetical protein
MSDNQWLFDRLVNTLVQPKPKPIGLVIRASNDRPNPTNNIPTSSLKRDTFASQMD